MTLAALVGEEVRFRALTYKDVYIRLLVAGTTGTDYADYLEYLGAGDFPEEMIE